MKRLIAEEEKPIVFSREDVLKLCDAAEKDVEIASEVATELIDKDIAYEEISDYQVEEKILSTLDDCDNFYECLCEILPKYTNDDIDDVSGEMMDNIVLLSVAMGDKPNTYDNIQELVYDAGASGLPDIDNYVREHNYQCWLLKKEAKEEEEYWDNEWYRMKL